MSERVPPGPDDASADPGLNGVSVAFMRLTGSCMQHLQSLGALAELEAKEAAFHFLRIAVMVGAALFFAAFGYVFLLLFVAFVIAALAGVSWIWISLGIALLHFLLMLLAASYVKRNWKQPIFQTLAAELKKDAAAMAQAGHDPGTTGS